MTWNGAADRRGNRRRTFFWTSVFPERLLFFFSVERESWMGGVDPLLA